MAGAEGIPIGSRKDHPMGGHSSRFLKEFNPLFLLQVFDHIYEEYGVEGVIGKG
jgi:hypothetical protein